MFSVVRCKKCSGTYKVRCNFCDEVLYCSYRIITEVRVCTELL